jgi:ppGpp synthetase/RelA/SpoT-type nucleotidyltranferase
MTELEKETERCRFWEETAKRYEKDANRYQKQLEEAHALIGRLIHQLSKRWDTAPLSKFMTGLLD